MVKIDIISGFLGAGKTTLIKKLLKEAFEGEQVVLIENEFGEIGIDGGFLKDAGIEIREMKYYQKAVSTPGIPYYTYEEMQQLLGDKRIVLSGMIIYLIEIT